MINDGIGKFMICTKQLSFFMLKMFLYFYTIFCIETEKFEDLRRFPYEKPRASQIAKPAETNFEQSMLSMFDNKKATNLTQSL